MQLLNLIFVLYGIPSLLAYVVVLISIRKLRKTLSHTFRNIFITAACYNVATYINTWFTMRLESEESFFFYYEWINKVAFLRNAQEICITYFYVAQNICVFFLSVDRFIAIVAVSVKMEIKEIWSKYCWIVLASTHFSVAATFIYTRLPVNSHYEMDNSGAFYKRVRSFNETPNITINRYIQIGSGAFVFIFCSIMNIVSLNMLYKFRRSLVAPKPTHSPKRRVCYYDLSLFLISLSVFLTQILNFCVMTATISLGDEFDRFHTLSTVMFFTSDLFSLGPAIYTLFVRGPIRSETVQIFRRNIISNHVAFTDIS